MKRKVLLFTITLILVVSLVPLAGVSAKQSSSASSAAAAATVQKKSIKTVGALTEAGYVCIKYKQKIKWWYTGRKITAYKATMTGRTYQEGWYYYGYYLWGESGGVGKRKYYRWTDGLFWHATNGLYYHVNIEQEVKKNGDSWDRWWWHG